MSLHIKYRPQTLADLKGNNEIKETLSLMLKDKDCPHAFLLHGPTGCGKTTIGRIIATELECQDTDFREINSADLRGIDTIRELRKQMQYRPLQGDVIVWLIDEAHKLTNDAQNALLKMLEDTPKHVYFILATTEPEKLIKTVRGRCSQFQVNLLSDMQMLRLLKTIVKQENKTLEREVYNQIIQDALGHPRNALTVLEQVLYIDPEKRLTLAKRAAEEQSKSIELCRILIKKSGWKQVALILSGLKGQDAESIRRAVLGYMQSILLKGTNDNAFMVMSEFEEPFYNSGFPGLVASCYRIVNDL